MIAGGFISLVVLTTIQVTKAASLEDAQQAYLNLDSVGMYLMGNISQEMFNLSDVMEGYFADERNAALGDVDNEVSNLLEKISEIVKNAEAAHVIFYSCILDVEDKIHRIANQAKNKIDNCYGPMLSISIDTLTQTWSWVLHEYESATQCSNSTLLQCQNYEDADECYEFVVATIGGTQLRMETTMSAILAEMRNKIKDLIFPCRGIVAQDLRFYPRILLDVTASCVSAATINSYNSIC